MTRFAIILFFLALVACNSNVEKVENVDDYGYKEVYQRDKEHFGKEGLYERFNEKGIKVEEALYKNDTLDGYRILYYENGDTQVVETYLEGRFEGPFKAYYESGQLEMEGQYVFNEMDGSWKRYYKNGQLMEDVTFRENAENGPFIEYHENGALKAEGTYINGDGEHGLLKLYDENGELVRTMNCDYGVCRTMWSKEKDQNRATDE
jgi:antitoxin component YwqK of YwqJK toxin-antitoxin module